MVVSLPDAERQLLRQAQRACRGKAGYVPVTVLLMLDRGRAVAVIAEDLGLDEATVYRYRQTYQLLGLAGYLRTEQPGYWAFLYQQGGKNTVSSYESGSLNRNLLNHKFLQIANQLVKQTGFRKAV